MRGKRGIEGAETVMGGRDRNEGGETGIEGADKGIGGQRKG